MQKHLVEIWSQTNGPKFYYFFFLDKCV